MGGIRQVLQEARARGSHHRRSAPETVLLRNSPSLRQDSTATGCSRTKCEQAEENPGTIRSRSASNVSASIGPVWPTITLSAAARKRRPLERG